MWGYMSVAVYRVMLIFVAVLLLAVGRYLTPESFHLKGSDEFYYLQYAQHIADNGARGFQDLVQWYAQSEENRYHPSPVRFAYVSLAALLVKIFGPSYSILVCISYASLLAFCAVCFYYARKLISDEFAVCFLLILCSSPLTLGMGCVALSDSFLNLLWGCSVWAFMDYIHKRSPGKMALLIVFLALSILTKESSVLLLGFVTVFILLARFFKIPVVYKDLIPICGIPVAIVVLVYLTVLGGFANFSIFVHSLYLTHFVDQANAYALDFSGGPWFRYFVDFMLLSPVVTLIAVGYAGHLLLERSREWKHMFFLTYFAAIYIPLSLLQHTKVVRFVINLEMVLALFCAWAVLEFFKKDIQKEKWGGALLTLLAISAVSFSSFFKLFAVASMLDPITYHLVQIQGFIP